MIFQLDRDQQRLVLKLEGGLRALLDTGAYIPVWTDDENVLVKNMKAEFVAREVSFTGFGGTATGNLYKVSLQVGELYYPNMSIVANQDLDTPFNMILSATMFQNLIYEVDDKNHMFNVSIPDEESTVRNLRIEDKDGKVHILCNSAD